MISIGFAVYIIEKLLIIIKKMYLDKIILWTSFYISYS